MANDKLLVAFINLLDTHEINDEKIRQQLTATFQRLLDTSHWQSIEGKALASLLYDGIIFYGQTNWELMVFVIAPVYQHAVKHVPIDTRRELQSAIKHAVEANQTSANALLPFLFLESDKAIVSTSAIDFAMIPKPPEDDQIGWPRRLATDLETTVATNKGAIMGGLITLGDRRVNDLLREVKWLLSDDEISTAASCVSGSSTVSAVEFWLEWAEEISDAGLENTRLFGAVASGLLILLKQMRGGEFADISRNFGYLHYTEEAVPPLVIHSKYLKSELAEHYADRFYALEAAESPPKLISEVIRYLDMEPRAPLKEQFNTQ